MVVLVVLHSICTTSTSSTAPMFGIRSSGCREVMVSTPSRRRRDGVYGNSSCSLLTHWQAVGLGGTRFRLAS